MFNFPDIKVHEGQVYFDKVSKKFFQVREQRGDIYIISSGTDYYNDATTHAFEVPVSADYVHGSVKVEALDAIEGVRHDGIGWTANDHG